jgi:hypothetical protein
VRMSISMRRAFLRLPASFISTASRIGSVSGLSGSSPGGPAPSRGASGGHRAPRGAASASEPVVQAGAHDLTHRVKAREY